MLYVFMGQQETHLKRLFKILDVMAERIMSKEVKHITYGKVLLSSLV